MPNALEKELKTKGLKDGKIQSIGFLVDELSPGQISYLLVNSINKYVESTVALCVNVFCIDWLNASLKMKFPIFHVKDLFSFKGTVFLMSKSAVFSSRDCHLPKKIYYLVDKNDIDDPELVNFVIKNNIPVITRSEDYKKLLETVGINCRYIIEDIDIPKLLEIANG